MRGATVRKFRHRLIAIGLCLLAVLFLRPAGAGVFNPETFTLANGLEVIVISDHRAPVVTHMVWYRVGAADEPAGQSGIAHFLEHLMFRGTKTLKDGEFSEIISRNGGRDNAFTSQDYTAYFQEIAVDKLDLVMGMEADRMVNLQLSESVIIPERSVVLEERRQRTDSNPGALLGEQMAAAQFLAHPYRNPVIGWAHEIHELDLQDAVGFYRDYYTPSNAILIVAGDVTGDQVRILAEKHYGKIPGRPVPERVRVKEPPQIAPRRITYTDSRVAQDSFRRTYLAPSRNSESQQHALPLAVLADVLGGGSTSRFYRELVVKQGIAAGASAYYNGFNYDMTRFWISALPKAGGDLGAIEQAVDAILRDVVENGVTEAEVERAKNSMLASAVYARDNIAGAARIFGSAMATGLSVEEIEAWPERVAAVTVEDVNAAARLVLDINKSVTGLLKGKQSS